MGLGKMKRPAPLPVRAFRLLEVSRRSSSMPAALLHQSHRRLRVDETVAVELAVAAPEDVDELALERDAAFEVAEEYGTALDDPARGDQHAAAEQVRGVASGSAIRACDIRFVAIDAE